MSQSGQCGKGVESPAATPWVTSLSPAAADSAIFHFSLSMDVRCGYTVSHDLNLCVLRMLSIFPPAYLSQEILFVEISLCFLIIW